MEIRIRLAELRELQWVNERYDEVKFMHSVFDREKIAIAEVDNKPAGLGRLVQLGGNDWEMGGIYVFKEFQGKGLAEVIVKFLVAAVQPEWRVFCLPFAPLKDFYARFGFIPCAAGMKIPDEISKKHQWCNDTYPDRTLLCVLR